MTRSRRAAPRLSRLSRLVCAALAALVLVLAAAYPERTAHAAEPAHIFMILWRGETRVERGFRAHMADAGLPVTYSIRNLDRDISRLPEVLAEARRTRPDLIYTWGTSITLGTVGRHDAVDPGRHITDIPVVYALVSDPWGTGIAPPRDGPAVGRPMVTGASHIAPLEAQIRAIRAYLPMDHLGVVYNPAEPNSIANLAALKRLTADLGFEVLEAPAPKGDDGLPDPSAIPDLVADLAERGADVLYIGPDNFIGAHHDTLTSAGIGHGLPAFTGTELEIRSGNAMFGLVSPYELVGRLAALKAHRILVDGADPATLPAETLERFTYVIRLPVAHKMGLYPPLLLLSYAEVIR